MCVFLFHSDSKLSVLFAGETITLVAGRSEDLLDVLIQNASDQQIDRIHLVYPHALPYGFTSKDRYFFDLSNTWAIHNHDYNRPYQEPPRSMSIDPNGGTGFKITARMPDPLDPIKVRSLEGWIRGGMTLQHYTPENNHSTLDKVEWNLLEWGRHAVLTALFEVPLQPGEKRWLRFQASGGEQPQNRANTIKRFLRRYLGRLEDTFEVAGPYDVHHRIVQFLRSVGAAVSNNSAKRWAPEAIQAVGSLERKLLGPLTAENSAGGARTAIEDWRIDVLLSYDRCDEPVCDGDVSTEGVVRGDSNHASRRMSFQYRAGKRNVEAYQRGGRFTVRLLAREVPLLVSFLPWIGIGLAILGIVLSLRPRCP